MDAVTRSTLADFTVTPALPTGRVVVRRITMAPSIASGPHTHNGPVFGVIESGSAVLQVGDGESTVLRAGDVFHEPAREVIAKFDATDEGVTFLGWFPVEEGVEPELTLLG
jgi:quercetin dioxygenase-like cupin family protein